MMKQIFASVLSVLAVSAACSLSAFAADSVNVCVTIADAEGNLALAAQPITVTDADGDGALTISDALYLAHEAHYEGGAAAGYGTSVTEFGPGITMLWGAQQGSSYGYCVNHTSALSLADPIKDGDVVSAYCYTDLTGFSDTYCYFDVNTVTAQAGEEVTLTLSANSYDANWNPIVVPVDGASLTIDGEASAWKTDAEGKVTLTFEESGSFTISAVSDTQLLVPPVCRAEITAAPAQTTAPETAVAPATTAAATTDAAATTTGKAAASTPASTGDRSGIFAIAAGALTCLAALAVTRRRNDGK